MWLALTLGDWGEKVNRQGESRRGTRPNAQGFNREAGHLPYPPRQQVSGHLIGLLRGTALVKSAHGEDKSMSRRHQPNAGQGLLRLVALLPWWAGVALAVISYVLLHHVATTTSIPMPQPGQVGATVAFSVWKSLAGVAQYLLPTIFLVGAAVSFMTRRHLRLLVDDVASNPARDALDGMGWEDFERLVGEGFRQQGYQVVETGGGGADGGMDLVLSRPSQNGREKFLVQCKQWRAHRVGVDVVRELYGVMAARGAAGGFVVTSGRFTEEAARFAGGRNITLLDGPQLLALIRSIKAAAGASRPTPAPRNGAQPETPTSQPMACPHCSKPMVRRVAKRGAQAGRAFWGCTGYPECRGTRPIN